MQISSCCIKSITSGYAMWFLAAPKPPKHKFLGVTQPEGSHSPYILGDTTRPGHVTLCPSLIEIGSKAAEKNSAQTNRQTNNQTDRQTDRHYENNGHLAVNQKFNFTVQLLSHDNRQQHLIVVNLRLGGAVHGVTVRHLGLQSVGRGFKSCSRQRCVTT